MTRSQSTWYAKVNDPNMQGGRLCYQFGTCKFASRKKTVSLTTDFKTVIGFNYAYKCGRAAFKAAGLSSILLGTTGTVKYKTGAGGYIRVSRATGGAKGAGLKSAWASAGTFWYELVGW